MSSFPLPEDIMMLISQLLPIESALSCKFVSKEWANLIADSKSFNLYTSNGARSAPFYLDPTSLCYLLIKPGAKNFIDLVAYPPFMIDKIPISIKNRQKHSFSSHQLLNSGPSNAIVCLNSAYGRFLFHNLLTGKSFSVDDSYSREPGFSQSPWSCYGFGYDPHSDDYKIVVLCRYYRANEILCWVYSFRSPGWKQFEGLAYDHDAYCWPYNEAYCFNGILHWIVMSWPSRDSSVIVTFDLLTLEFGAMSLPDAGVLIHRPDASLVELNGRLCYFYSMRDCSCEYCKFEVWVMNEYGVQESWEKFVSIDYETKINSEWCSLMPRMIYELAPLVLYECEDGAQVMLFVWEHDTRLVWYDIRDNRLQLIGKKKMKRLTRKYKPLCKGKVDVFLGNSLLSSTFNLNNVVA